MQQCYVHAGGGVGIGGMKKLFFRFVVIISSYVGQKPTLESNMVAPTHFALFALAGVLSESIGVFLVYLHLSNVDSPSCSCKSEVLATSLPCIGHTFRSHVFFDKTTHNRYIAPRIILKAINIQ